MRLWTGSGPSGARGRRARANADRMQVRVMLRSRMAHPYSALELHTDISVTALPLSACCRIARSNVALTSSSSFA